MWWCWEIQESINKALRDQLAAVLDELHRIEAGQGVNEELLDTIQMITTIMKGMQVVIFFFSSIIGNILLHSFHNGCDHLDGVQ